jgi:uncharacterized protein YfaT (DUF1175 family)
MFRSIFCKVLRYALEKDVTRRLCMLCSVIENKDTETLEGIHKWFIQIDSRILKRGSLWCEGQNLK